MQFTGFTGFLICKKNNSIKGKVTSASLDAQPVQESKQSRHFHLEVEVGHDKHCFSPTQKTSFFQN